MVIYFKRMYKNNLRFRVLLVDDDPHESSLAELYLKREGFEVIPAFSAKDAYKCIFTEKPDIILVDPGVEGMEGLNFIKKVKTHRYYRFLPVIALIGDEENPLEVIRRGADDFLKKPVDPLELIARVSARGRLRNILNELEYVENALYTLARLVEIRDSYTEEHTERVASIAVRIGRELGKTGEELGAIRKGALLHDIGKIGVPDSILLKRGSLSEKEYEIMKRHTIIGYEVCKGLRTLKESLHVILYHHERWDGEGYPEGLLEKKIPLPARIVSVADAFDAMTSERPYRRALTKNEALSILEEGAGSQWDPEIVRIAVDILKN